MGWRRTQVELYCCRSARQKIVSVYMNNYIYAAANNLLLEMNLEEDGRDIGRLISILTEESNLTASSKGRCKLLRG